MINMDTISRIIKDNGAVFMPPHKDILEWSKKYGRCNLMAVSIIDDFFDFIQEWNDKDLSSGNEADTIDKPMDNYYSKCCNADILLNVCDEGTHYAICTMCHSPCDVVKDE